MKDTSVCLFIKHATIILPKYKTFYTFGSGNMYTLLTVELATALN